MFGFTEIAAIVVICYLIGEAIKVSKIDNKYVPVMVGVCGAILGVCAYYVMPGLEIGNIMDAIASGIVSGLSATGANQVYKQLKGAK